MVDNRTIVLFLREFAKDGLELKSKKKKEVTTSVYMNIFQIILIFGEFWEREVYFVFCSFNSIYGYVKLTHFNTNFLLTHHDKVKTVFNC